MSDSLSVELEEPRRQVARDYPEVEVALATRARVLSAAWGGRPVPVMVAVLAYRTEPRQLWAPVILDLMAPAILASLQRLREEGPVAVDEDLSQQLILEVLSAAASMPLPANPTYMRRRLIARANQGVRRWLEREGRRQNRQDSYEVHVQEGH